MRQFTTLPIGLLCGLAGLILTTGTDLSRSVSPIEEKSGFVGDLACRSCHREIFDSYVTTGHHLTSRLPSATSIAGSFAKGHDTLTTFNPELTFAMEARNGRFYETALREKNGRTSKRPEEIAFVIGSAKRGQTYLYWKQNALFELPVSYWTSLHHWVNSPGYVDGSADFDRPVVPRCLECHTTYFEPLTTSSAENRYSRENITLGISCERCHGEGREHVKAHTSSEASSAEHDRLAPAGLSRDRQIDVCAQCHGGAGEPVASAFSFKPGQTIASYLKLQTPEATDRLDVHGNQVNLLERSRCFQASPQMSCSTCHDVHKPERPAADYSARCLVCHRVNQCGMFNRIGPTIASNCVDCHMPVQASNTLVLDADDTRLEAHVRTHWIRIYRNLPRPLT